MKTLPIMSIMWIAFAMQTGCGSVRDGAPDAAADRTGAEGGPCFANGTCDDGLACLSDLCVRPADAGTEADAAMFPSGFESFEAIGDGNLITPFQFSSGISLTMPAPNPTDSFGVIIVDCFDGGGFFGFSCDDFASIPEGTAFLGVASLGLSFSELEFTFPVNVDQVEATITASNADVTDEFILTAHDDSGLVVAMDMVSGVPVTSWATNQATVSGVDRIRSVRIRSMTSGSLALDLLRWVND